MGGLGFLLFAVGSLFPQTFVDTTTGLMVSAPGVAPVFSIPFMVGGAVMILVSPLLKPSGLPVLPPEGYRFCIFCSNPVLLTAGRCDRCNGVQPKGV